LPEPGHTGGPKEPGGLTGGPRSRSEHHPPRSLD